MRRLTSRFAAARAELAGPAILPFEYKSGRQTMREHVLSGKAAANGASGNSKSRFSVNRVWLWQMPLFSHLSVALRRSGRACAV